MLESTTEFIYMTITNIGEIGAGRVVPFARPSKTQEIMPVPSSIVHLKPMKFVVRGDSFIDEGYRNGAIMICRERFERSEVTPGKLCIVRVAGIDDMMKRVFIETNGMVRLRAGNASYEDKFYAAEFVEIVALVVCEIRMCDLKLMDVQTKEQLIFTEPELPAVAPSKVTISRAINVFCGVLWLAIIPFAGYALLILISGLANAESAPQQGAVAAMAAAWAVVPYCGIRGVTEFLKSFIAK
jgi:hypothetical protein